MKKTKAFTLVETLIAITVMTVVMTAITGLVLGSMGAHQRNVHQLQALAYAQEGLEAMRFIRDSNWKQNYTWSRGFELQGVGESAVFVKEVNCPPCLQISSNEGDGILENKDGFTFERVIHLKPIDLAEAREALEVTSTVSWKDRGAAQSVELSTILTDWR